ncbi:MAG: FRG domain-containing protein [Candidatus Sedimenticola sp. (ex Thyasira tokunagai)]
MEDITIASLEDLESTLFKYRNGYLFRGQTSHHLNSDKKVNIPTSFTRHGCVPPLMLKWTHYANAIIRAFGGEDYHNINLEYSQAILQHYGWRSFYIDLTKSPYIACWFAANKYEENKTIQMCENYEENPVWLVHKNARYVETNKPGNVYIIDRCKLNELDAKIYDLSEIETEEGKLRFQVQSACLAGNLKGQLPHQSVIAHLKIKYEVLVEYYNKHGINSTCDVFPGREEDFILQSLLNIPWNGIPIDTQITSYKRGLELPEYDAEFRKHLNPKITLYSKYWISENRGNSDSYFYNIPFYKFSEQAYYANSNSKFSLSRINCLLNEHNMFVIELDGLINIIESTVDYEYEKGVVVEKHHDNVVSVSGLYIEHPGHVVSGIGAVRGWYYRIEGEHWARIEHLDQCPCKNSLRHELQFSLLRVLNDSIEANEIIMEDSLNYRHNELEPS